jgi:hypothetical protein
MGDCSMGCLQVRSRWEGERVGESVRGNARAVQGRGKQCGLGARWCAGGVVALGAAHCKGGCFGGAFGLPAARSLLWADGAPSRLIQVDVAMSRRVMPNLST